MPAAGLSPTHSPPRRTLRRVLWSAHSVLGLTFGLLLILLSASGALLVVHHELEDWLERDWRIVTASNDTPLPLADLARRAAALAPTGHRLFRVEPSVSPTSSHKFLFLASDQTTRWSAFVHPTNGLILWHGPDQSLLTPWLLHLHMQLQAGRAGYYVTLPAGFALVLLSVSGFWIYRHRLTALARHPFRLRLGWRVALMDLHNWIGVASLYFTFTLGLTGALYVLTILNARPAPTAPVTFSPAALAPLEPMLAEARTRFPSAEILRAQFPARADAPVIVLLIHRDAPVWQKFSRVEFNATTGAVKQVRDARTLPAADQFRSMLAPLHFGFYGATWVKWAYFVGGLSPALLGVSGLALWWLRRRRHQRAVRAAHPSHAAELGPQQSVAR